jgi:hypothetical protein
MRVLKHFVILTVAALAVFAVSSAVADDHREKNEKGFIELDVSCPDGKLVVDIHHKVVNDGDSGVTRYWAFDTYQRHVRAWQTGPTTFCAVVQYEGEFVATAGPSPAGTDANIAAGITGTMTGGYRGTITGTLNPNPAYKRKGYIGTFDYGWAGDPDNGPPTPFRWLNTYFLSGYTFDFLWWGWAYRTEENGVWLNTAGNAGDITDGP